MSVESTANPKNIVTPRTANHLRRDCGPHSLI